MFTHFCFINVFIKNGKLKMYNFEIRSEDPISKSHESEY